MPPATASFLLGLAGVNASALADPATGTDITWAVLSGLACVASSVVTPATTTVTLLPYILDMTQSPPVGVPLPGPTFVISSAACAQLPPPALARRAADAARALQDAGAATVVFSVYFSTALPPAASLPPAAVANPSGTVAGAAAALQAGLAALGASQNYGAAPAAMGAAFARMLYNLGTLPGTAPPLTFAALAVSPVTLPTPTPSPSPAADPCPPGSACANAPAIIGGTIGGLVLVLLLCSAGLYARRASIASARYGAWRKAHNAELGRMDVLAAASSAKAARRGESRLVSPPVTSGAAGRAWRAACGIVSD